jgi:cobyrinic acid a,c-diamide synthase
MGDLIERLREKHENEVIYRQEYHLEVCAEAADALEAKDAEIARLSEAAKEVVETHLLTGGGSPEAWAKHCSALATLRAALGD